MYETKFRVICQCIKSSTVTSRNEECGDSSVETLQHQLHISAWYFITYIRFINLLTKYR